MSAAASRRAATLALMAGILGMLESSRVGATSISDSLGQFINREIGRTVENLSFPNIAGEFIQREALGSLQLPVPATSTSFTYSYNPALGTFERAAGSLGPVFVDRADTLGEGHFDLLFSYQFANLTDLDGEPFGRQLQFLFTGIASGFPVAGAFHGRNLSLTENVFSFNGTYGITPRWDVNLLVPIIYTTLDLDGNVRDIVGSVVGEPTLVRFHDDAFGIGDILLRTKYRFFDDPDVVMLAGAITLGMPSGNPANFQGLGDFTITPTLIASRAIGRHNIHANLGMEFNTADSQRTRARYAIGATIQPREWLAFLLDILGSSGLDDDRFSVPTGNVTPICNHPEVVRCVNYSATRTSVNGVVPRSDIVDLSAGIKFNPFASANVYLLAIIPLTQQGLRAAVVPAGGFEWTF
jgi:Putative MetA-pathway of phenol degradation